MPALSWLPRYEWSRFSLDAVAGLTVWALIVPEALAYAAIAGVPVQFGLYAVPLSLLGYAVFGGCRELVVGPSATVASLSAATVGSIAVATSDGNAYVALTGLLAVTVGVLYVLGGLLRLGLLANFFARPVLDGFILGLGLYIVVGQLPKLVGISKPSGDTVAVLVQTIAKIGSWSGVTTVVGVIGLGVLFGLKRWAPKVPAAIAVAVVSIAAVKAFHLTEHGVKVVGAVPTGFHFVPYSGLSWSDLGALGPGALAIVIVGFAQSVAIAKAYATEHHYTIDASQEMVGYGAANVGAGLLQGYTVTGSLSKSAAGQEARARSQLAWVVTAVLVLLTALFLAGLFRDLPETILAAIVIEAVSGMLKPGKLMALRRARTPEFWAATGALAGVVLIDILPGVVIGVALSFALLIHAFDHPHIARLGRSRDGARFVDVDTNTDITVPPAVLVERFEAPLVFTNAELFFSELTERVRQADPRPRALVVDLEAVTQVDVTGADALRRLHDSLDREHVGLVLARPDASVRSALERHGVLAVLGADRVVATVREAVELSPELAI